MARRTGCVVVVAAAIAVASSARDRQVAERVAAIGEVGLAGELRRVPGTDRRLAEAERLGFSLALVPAGSGIPTGGKGSVIQLGAFANQAQAERAWSALSARFPSVGAMNKMIVPFSGGIRLRASAASPAAARDACQALKVAGENCFVAN